MTKWFKHASPQIEVKPHQDMKEHVITFHELAEIIERLGNPLELLLHPDDYISGVAKFAHPGMRGHDDKGEYMMFLTTKLRPNPPIIKQETVDMSKEKLGWI